MARRISRPLHAGAALLPAVLALLASAAPAPARQDAATLEAGVPVERELKGGVTHAFRVRLAAGQFLAVVVEQKGIDVATTLEGPDGKQLAASDSQNGTYGPEPLVAVAREAGDYALKVSPTMKTAAAGLYQIKVVELRAAAPADERRVAAERAFEAAEKLLWQQSAAGRRAAIEKYREALPFFREAGDRYRHALTLFSIGVAHIYSSELQQALDHFNQSLPLFRALPDSSMEAKTLNYIGGVHDILGDWQKALSNYEQALPLFRAVGDRLSEASALNNIGKLYSGHTDWQRALDYYNRAVRLFHETGARDSEAIALNNVGWIHNNLNEPVRALEYFRQSLQLSRAANNKRRQADALTNMGRAYRLLGQPAKAVEAYDEALPLRREVGDRRAEGSTLDALGAAYSAQGAQDKALEYHGQALKLLREVEDRRGEAVALGNIGRAHHLAGRPQEALEHETQALAIFRALGDRQNQARMLEALARAERDLGRLGEARAQAEAALALVEQVRAGVGSRDLRTSYFSGQGDAYQFYIDLLMQQHRAAPAAGHDAEALAASERARARGLLESLAEARVDFRQGADPDLVARERDLGRQLDAKAERLVQLLGRKGTEAQTAALKREIDELKGEYEKVLAEVRERSPRYAALTQPRPLDLRQMQAELDGDTMLLEYSLGPQRSYLWAVTPDRVRSFELVGQKEIEQAARRVYGLLTARSTTPRGESAVLKRRRVAAADAELPAAAAELSRLVLAPAADHLGGKRLLVVADGVLQYIPFAMLPQPGTPPGAAGAYRPLVLSHEIVSLPSASALAVQRRGLKGRRPAPEGLAVIADPVFSGRDERLGRATAPAAAPPADAAAADDTRLLEHLSGGSADSPVVRRLPYTRQEAEEILKAAPARGNLKALDFEASRALVTGGRLSRYRYVHFATHGYLDSERPELSAVVLSLVDERGRPQNGFLLTRDVYNLDLPAELVVLSACQTGLGKETRGEGLEGITRGFMYAGAARVAVSLWSVNDRATAELMRRFYRGMLREGLSPAAALRAAQVEMYEQRQWQSPYYWAPFELQGEWR